MKINLLQIPGIVNSVWLMNKHNTDLSVYLEIHEARAFLIIIFIYLFNPLTPPPSFYPTLMTHIYHIILARTVPPYI